MKKNWFDYVILIFGATLAVLTLTFLDPSARAKFFLSCLIGIFYGCWGIWHHARSRDLTWAVALEYLAFGAFISVLLIVSLEE